jgi:adenosylmethionine-8-amino-7-oxononanoate aminotransferase
MLSEAGCTTQEIATITGHSIKTVNAVIEKYLARTRTLAHQAILKFENSPRTEFANSLQTKAPSKRHPKGKSDV